MKNIKQANGTKLLHTAIARVVRECFSEKVMSEQRNEGCEGGNAS